jgi:hypothetical protein
VKTEINVGIEQNSAYGDNKCLEVFLESKDYHKSIAKGMCGTCGKNPLVLNRSECEQCLIKRRSRQKKEYQQGRDKAKNEKRNKFIEMGLCGRCGKRPPSSGLITCQPCLDRQNELHSIMKDKVFEGYGGYKCACCGETTKQFLTLDHVNNDGAEHRKFLTGSSRKGSHATLYGWIVRENFPETIQVLCMNCNWGKRMNNGVCPHKNSYPT